MEQAGGHSVPGEYSRPLKFHKQPKKYTIMATEFFKCPICGNVIMKIEDSGVIPHCCGQEMTRMQAHTADPSDKLDENGNVVGATEKHLPTVERKDDCTVIVRVGSDPHPMTQLHHICFIWLETAHGGQLRYLSPVEARDESKAPDCGFADKDGKSWQACAEFCGCKDPVTAVYSYCNLHGLWKLEVNEKTGCRTGKCCGK